MPKLSDGTPSNTMVASEPKTMTVAYHPGKQTVVEIWSEGDPEAVVARLPSGELVYDEHALEVLNTVMHDEDTLVRKVTPRDFDGVFG